jgi:hypothetical protein
VKKSTVLFVVSVIALVAGLAPTASAAGRPTWHLQTVPSPSNTQYDSLGAVSCATPQWCLAVGGQNFNEPLSALWNGTSWVAAPAYPAAITQTPSISCPAAGHCFVAGGAAVAAYQASSWVSVPIGWTTTSNVDLTGISCATTTSCVAVGSELLPNNRTALVAVASAGGTWRQVPIVAQPFGLTAPALNSISCASPSMCLTVGVAARANGTGTRPVALIWSGKAFHLAATGLPTKGFWLDSVSCPSPAFCLAVGAGAPGIPHGYIWSGQDWTRTNTLGSQFNLGVQSASVSCWEPRQCMLIATDSDGGSALSARFQIGNWEPVKVPDPVVVLAMQMGTISCAATAHCMAVGFTGASPAQGAVPFAEDYF